MRDIILFPDNPGRHWIAGVLRHPRDSDGVFAVHPVAFVGIDPDEMLVALSISFTKGGQLLFPPGCHFVAVVGCIFPAHLQGERQVAQAQWRSLIRVAGHHGCGSPAIGHSRRQLINAIASR